MILTFLFAALIRCTFFANRFMNENKRFRQPLSGCTRPRWWLSATLLLGIICSAQQYPGQPVPQRGRPPLRGTGGLPGPTGERDVRPTFEGDVKSISKKELFISSETGNGLKFVITGKTTAYDGDKKIKVTSLQTGQHIMVEAQLDVDGSYDAVNVRLKVDNSAEPAKDSPTSK
jgi:hypothetical protein